MSDAQTGDGGGGVLRGCFLPRTICSPTGALTVLCAASVVLALVLSAFFRNKHSRRAIIALFAFAAGLAAFMLHSARTTVPAHELDGETVEMTAVLLDYPDEYVDYCRAEVRLGGALPHLKAILYDNGGALAAAEPGQTVRLTAKLRAADTRWGKDYDYYNSKGIYLTASAKSDIEILPQARRTAALWAAARSAAAQSITRIFRRIRRISCARSCSATRTGSMTICRSIRR